MVHASVTYLTTIGRVGCGLRKRKSEELIGTVEVKTKNKIMTGKIEEKKKFGQMRFHPFIPSNLATLKVPGPTKSPLA